MEYAIELLQRKIDLITYNLKEFISIKNTETWKDLNQKKRECKKAIKILKEYSK